MVNLLKQFILLFTFILMASLNSTFSKADETFTLKTDAKGTLSQLNGLLSQLSKNGKNSAPASDQQTLKLTKKIIKACQQKENSGQCSDPDTLKIIELYGKAVSLKQFMNSKAEVELLLSIRNAYFVGLNKHPSIPVIEGLEELGVTNVGSGDAGAFGNTVSNTFLKNQIEKLLPNASRDYLQIEETYQNSFNGEYLSSNGFAETLKKTDIFIKKHPANPFASHVKTLKQKCESFLAQLKGSDVLNQGLDLNY